MDPKEFTAFLGVLERLKCTTRHSWTSTGRHETVASHSWRLAAMAYLIRDEMPDVDFDRVLLMCLVHDFGEAVTGDIPSFLKSRADEAAEAAAVDGMLGMLPAGRREALAALFAEMDALQTPEARVFKALDKLEAVLQHNEAPLSTWLPLEYELQLTYGAEEAEEFPFLKALRGQIAADTKQKIAGGER
ncbi:MAG: HD domain-containing protein [Firmicutes bacterium]|nr:HD domain-containing protein [Bacillota bacterium]